MKPRHLSQRSLGTWPKWHLPAMVVPLSAGEPSDWYRARERGWPPGGKPLCKSARLQLDFNSCCKAIFLQPTVLFLASASMSGLVLTLVAVFAAVLGTWRLGADPGWTSHFFVADGLLSRYQLWFAVAIGAQTSAFVLNRLGGEPE